MAEAKLLLFGGIPAGLAVLAPKRNQRLGELAAGTLAVSVRQGDVARPFPSPSAVAALIWCRS